MNKLFKEMKEKIELNDEFKKRFEEKYPEIDHFFEKRNIPRISEGDIVLSESIDSYINKRIINYFEEKLLNIETRDLVKFSNELEEIYLDIKHIEELLKEENIEVELNEIKIEDTINLFAEKLEEEIEDCSSCNPMHHLQEKEDMFLISEREIDEFIQEYIRDEELAKLIQQSMKCPACGNTELIEIITKEEMNLFYGINLNYFRRYDIEITKEEMEEFTRELLTYPMLALSNETAKKIKQVIKKEYDNTNHIKSNDKLLLYKGRKRKKDSPKFKAKDLGIAPFGKTSHGRYNFVGENVLYCTNKINKLYLELDMSYSELIDVISLNIKENKKIFEIENVFTDFKELYSENEVESGSLKGKYLLSNFISQCVKYAGYSGIKYNCVHDDGIENYAIFSEESVIYEEEIKTYNINDLI